MDCVRKIFEADLFQHQNRFSSITHRRVTGAPRKLYRLIAPVIIYPVIKPLATTTNDYDSFLKIGHVFLQLILNQTCLVLRLETIEKKIRFVYIDDYL